VPDKAETDRATTPRETSEGMVTSTNDVSSPRNSANCKVRSAPGGRSKSNTSSFPQATDARTSPNAANSFVARQVWDSPWLTDAKSSASDSGRNAPTEKTETPSRDLGSAIPSAPGTGTAPRSPVMRACVGPLKSASTIATLNPRAANAAARARVTVLFPTPPFPDPTATRWRTFASARLIRSFCSPTCSRMFEPPSPAMSW